jgi:glycine oxidase
MKSENQRRLWESKTHDEDSGSFMRDSIVEEVHGLHSDFGYGFVQESGNINMPTLLNGFRKWLSENEALMIEAFDYNSLVISGTHVEYKGRKSDRIIFCQGHENVLNPYFKDLPFIAAKGEILIIESQELQSQNIIHDRINIVPLGNDTYWVGSTFSWDKLDLETTEDARKDLENQLKKILQVPFKVVDHKVGIRPTVKDRRPLLGMHSQYKRLGIFNGLGTRGVMLAPYFANHFVDHIYTGSRLNSVVDIRRFNAKE